MKNRFLFFLILFINISCADKKESNKDYDFFINYINWASSNIDKIIEDHARALKNCKNVEDLAKIIGIANYRITRHESVC